eukprot:1187685-Prorocentrum_minimum.AAC.1
MPRDCHVSQSYCLQPLFALILRLRWHRYDIDTCHHIFDRAVHINWSIQRAARAAARLRAGSLACAGRLGPTSL